MSARKATNYLKSILLKEEGFVCSECGGVVQYVDGFICPACGEKAFFTVKKRKDRKIKLKKV